MKTLALSLLAVLSLSAHADVRNSKLEKRHQNLIKKAVFAKCDIYRGFIYEFGTKITPKKIDQGITDYEYETVLEANEEIDQGQYNTYKVTVKSSYSDGYNHPDQTWGSYSVDAISECELQR
ncbi:MAG: hypothetical protein NDI69_17675 [Bacteriovoracaceae bacterium]|nr:hypothetical protein [Bacteriovoracaceae bacterium]